jgi:hypothetical protein
LVILATAAIVVGGQTVVPVIGSANAQTAASIPDFSGIWGHPYFPGFEPPVSGPGPIVNKSRRRQVFGTDGPLAPGTNAPLVSDPRQYVGDYTNPILKPLAAEAVRKQGEIELSGVSAPIPSNQCWPEPVPYIFWNLGMQLLQQPGKVTILYDEDHEVRHVRMNETHPVHVTPSWHGDSVGHYEGDTLVIDTVGVKTDRPFAMVDHYGTPYSEALHVVERYRLVDYEVAKEAQERGAKENFRLSEPPKVGHPIPGTRARAFSFISRSRMKASSRRRGQQPSRIDALWRPSGGKLSAPKIRMNTMLERTPRYRARTSRISERGS